MYKQISVTLYHSTSVRLIVYNLTGAGPYDYTSVIAAY